MRPNTKIFEPSDMYTLRTKPITKIRVFSTPKKNTVWLNVLWPEPKHNDGCTCVLGTIMSYNFPLEDLHDVFIYIAELRDSL